MDIVKSDVIDAMIFVARSRAFRLLVRSMKRGPNSKISLAVTCEQNFFRRHERNSQRIILKDELVEVLAVDKNIEEARAIRIVKIDQSAQLQIAAQPMSQQSLIIAISILRAI